MKPIKPRFTATVSRANPAGGEAATFTTEVVGRTAWCLLALLQAGHRGCTPISRPAPRWSHYTWCLRGQGINVATIDESHPGSYAGSHARYKLVDSVAVSGGNLDQFLASPEGREFSGFSFARAA